MVAPRDHREVLAFRYGPYAHIRLEVHKGPHLPQLPAEGLVLELRLRPRKSYAYLRLLRVYSSCLNDNLNCVDFEKDSAYKYGAADPDALFEFARKGLGMGHARLSCVPTNLRLLGGLAQSLNLVGEGKQPYDSLSNWMSFRPSARKKPRMVRLVPLP